MVATCARAERSVRWPENGQREVRGVLSSNVLMQSRTDLLMLNKGTTASAQARQRDGVDGPARVRGRIHTDFADETLVAVSGLLEDDDVARHALERLDSAGEGVSGAGARMRVACRCRCRCGWGEELKSLLS